MAYSYTADDGSVDVAFYYCARMLCAAESYTEYLPCAWREVGVIDVSEYPW